MVIRVQPEENRTPGVSSENLEPIRGAVRYPLKTKPLMVILVRVIPCLFPERSLREIMSEMVQTLEERVEGVMICFQVVQELLHFILSVEHHTRKRL
jgi:hypothetical protein